MRLLAIEAAILDGNLALRLEQRRLADDVDDAAIGALAVEHGRGAAKHFDAVERVDVDARNGAEIIILPHPVLILDGVEPAHRDGVGSRSEEHTSELQSLMRISYAVFCLKKKKT